MRTRNPLGRPGRRWAALISAVALLAGIGAFWQVAAPAAGPTASCPAGRLMNIVAHEDDDLLFLSPALENAISGGECVRTVFLTAGDDNNGSHYWLMREGGPEAAYAEMAGVRDLWSSSTQTFAGHPLTVETLLNDPVISLVFMRLPDGSPSGAGNSRDRFQSLQKLYQGTIPTINALDGSTSYTRNGLVRVLTALMIGFGPRAIHTQDYAGRYGDGDHSDHHSTAYLARLADLGYRQPHVFVGYQDYGTSARPANVRGAALAAKSRAFYTYAAYDRYACHPERFCAHTEFPTWLARQYVVGRIRTGPSGVIAGAGG